MAKQEVKLAEALVIVTDKGGDVRRIDSKVTLSVADKTLVKVGNAKVNGKWMPNFAPSATGIKRLATHSGIVAVEADEVTVGGLAQLNGYRDPETKVIYYRYRAYGFNEMGLMCSAGRTVSYSVEAYNRQDLLSKAKQGVTWLKPYPTGISDKKKQDLIDEGWGCYNIDEAFDVWCDLSKKEFLEMKGAMEHREIHADRTCQTFAERNARAAHPAFPTKTTCNTEALPVACKMWFDPDGGGMRFDGSKFSDKAMKKAIEAHGTLTDDEDVNVVEEVSEMAQTDPTVAKIVDEVASEDMEAGRQREIDPDDDLDYDGPEEDGKPPAAKPTEEPVVDGQKAELIKRIEEMATSHSISFKKACELQTVNPDDLQASSTEDLLEVDRLLRASVGNIGQ